MMHSFYTRKLQTTMLSLLKAEQYVNKSINGTILTRY